MIFVDLDNGLTYNGEQPYVHWFDDEQSTNLNYVKKLCFIIHLISLYSKRTYNPQKTSNNH